MTSETRAPNILISVFCFVAKVKIDAGQLFDFWCKTNTKIIHAKYLKICFLLTTESFDMALDEIIHPSIPWKRYYTSFYFVNV
jgi:hypothetical protein